jgi:hypothetical protein
MALKFGTDTVNSVNFVDNNNTYEVKQIVKDGTSVWCKEYHFYAQSTKKDNLMNLTFQAVTNGVNVANGSETGVYNLSGSANQATWIIRQFTFVKTGTYYVRNFNYSSSHIVRCYLASFSDSRYPDNYWLEGSNLVFNITTANTTCNFCLYVSADKTNKTISQTLKIYIGMRNKTSWSDTAAADSSDCSASITDTQEPTASTGDISNNSVIHFNDNLSLSFSKGTESDSPTTTYNTTLSSLTAPALTKVYTGSFGAVVQNNNSISVTAKYYMKYGSARTPSSGYRTTTIAANGSASLTGLTSQQNTTLYVFFEATKTATTTTHTRTYNATISGLDNVVSRDTYETSTMVTRTTTGNATANVNIDVTVVDSENSSTSSSTLSSSTASVTLGY